MCYTTLFRIQVFCTCIQRCKLRQSLWLVEALSMTWIRGFQKEKVQVEVSHSKVPTYSKLPRLLNHRGLEHFSIIYCYLGCFEWMEHLCNWRQSYWFAWYYSAKILQSSPDWVESVHQERKPQHLLLQVNTFHTILICKINSPNVQQIAQLWKRLLLSKTRSLKVVSQIF